MRVWENLTSSKGAQIEVHLEDENTGIFLIKNYSRNQLQDRLRILIDCEKSDTGNGTVVHLLINSQGIGKSMSEAKYAVWQAKEEKDWFHEHHQHPLDELLSILPLILHDGMIGRHSDFGMPMEIRIIKVSPCSKDEFVGPTTKELEEIFSDPKNRRRISIMERKKSEHDCRLCLKPLSACPFRRASYDHKEMKAALEKIH